MHPLISICSLLVFSARRILLVLSVLFTVMLFSGCAEISGAAAHGWEGTEYENTYLSTSSPLGAKALKNWRAFDFDVRQFLQKYRDPDVIYSKELEVTFFYVKERVQVRFDRPAVGLHTKMETLEIPDALYQTLSTRFQLH